MTVPIVFLALPVGTYNLNAAITGFQQFNSLASCCR